MSKQKTYSWNRNSAHHRIALTRFSAIALIYSLAIGGLFLVGFVAAGNNTREYVVISAAMILVAIVSSFSAILYLLTALYVWVNSGDLYEKDPPTPPGKERIVTQAWYQTDNGWELVGKGGGAARSQNGPRKRQ